MYLGRNRSQRTCCNWFAGVTVLVALAAVSDGTIRNGSDREFQRYLCNNCDLTFNDKTGIIFAHLKIALRRWLFSVYAFLRFNTSLRQLQCEIDVTHKTSHRLIERFASALDAPSLDLVGPVEIDEVYVSAGKKGRERDGWSRDKILPDSCSEV